MAWDDFLTRIGDALVTPQNPWGAMMPTPPQDRRQMISNALITLGGNLAAGGAAGQPTMASLGRGFENLAEQGTRRGMQQLQGYMLGSKIQEAQRQNQTRDMLRKMPPPEGVDKALWPMMIESATGPDMIKMLMEANRDARTTRALAGDSGAAPPAGTPGPSANPTLDPNNIGNMRDNQKGGFRTYPDPVAGVTDSFNNVKYWVGKGAPTFAQLGRRWLGVMDDTSTAKLPTGDNPAAWSAAVAKMAGLGPNDPVPINDPQKMALVMKGINVIEHGRQTVPDEAYLQGVTGQRSIPPMQTAGVTQPNPGPSSVPSYGPTMAIPGGPPQIAPAPPAGPSPAPQAQATPPAQYPQTAPPAAPKPDYQNDPEIQSLLRTRQQMLATRDPKFQEKIPEIDKAIAARKGQLEGRGFELERSQQQGAERARIMRDTEIYKVDVKDAAEYAQGIQSSALKSRSARANIQQLDALLANVDTGRFKETTTDIKRMAKGVGIDLEKLGITDDVPRAEAARALVGAMSLQLRDPSAGAGMPGAMSDQDRKFLASMVPGLEATPEGRKLMLTFMSRLHDYNIGMAKEVSKYRQSPEWKTNPQGVVDIAQGYAEKNPIFSQADIDAVTKMKTAAPPTLAPQQGAGQQAPVAITPSAIDAEIERRRKAGQK